MRSEYVEMGFPLMAKLSNARLTLIPQYTSAGIVFEPRLSVSSRVAPEVGMCVRTLLRKILSVFWSVIIFLSQFVISFPADNVSLRWPSNSEALLEKNHTAKINETAIVIPRLWRFSQPSAASTIFVD